MSLTKNAIFVEINERFLPYLDIFLKSLFHHNPDCPDILIFHTDLGEAQLQRLRKYTAVKTMRLEDNDFASGPPMAAHYPKFADPRISYARFLIWTDRMNGYENVTHLDTDLLIVGRLDELFACDRFTIFSDLYQAEDALFHNPRDPDLIRLLDEDGIRLPSVVGNCGVFVVPSKDRSMKEYEMLCYLLKRYEKHIKWADQSIINLWMAKKGIGVTEGRRFNYQHRLIAKPDSMKELHEARIFHFNGVDLRYRIFLVWCASYLCRIPYGWNAYRAIYRVAYDLLRQWRSKRNFFRYNLSLDPIASPILKGRIDHA